MYKSWINSSGITMLGINNADFERGNSERTGEVCLC